MPQDLSQLDPAWAWSPYTPDKERPWTRARSAHLFRRAGFGATSRELDEAAKQEPADVVKKLVLPNEGNAAFERQFDELGRTMLAGGNPESLSAWWLYRMTFTPDPLLEKATLFWHGHFATSAAKVTEAKAMLAQNDLLRKHARGDFAALVLKMSRDPAMLIYLDSATNRKTHPNENYARELMELFCLGLGNYTEKDIQQVARCFTGWEVRRGSFVFNAYEHDVGVKSFLGSSGQFDGDDAAKVVLAQPAAARFIVSKLLRFYVCDEPAFPEKLVEPLAKEYRENGYNTGLILGKILGSQLFFSEYALGRKIRSPIELGVGLLKSLEGQTNLNVLAQELAQLGHAPFFPPNVKGWDGGRTWINSSTLLARSNLVRQLVLGGQTRFGGGNLESYLSQQGVSGPAETVAWFVDLLVAVPVPAAAREPLVALAGGAGGDKNRRLGELVHAIGTLPEYQLS